MDASYSTVKPGDLLAGKYRVEQVLGRGAMGVVVAAMHVDLHERRAIKFMLPSMLVDREGVERFLREARSAVRLKSQHVAKIHDIGRLENGAPYMVMELLQGNDLKAVLEHRGPLPVPEAVGYMMQVCEAIAEAHELGIVHRDLKPANIYVTRGANGLACVKVLDFGIAKLLGNPDGVELTQTSNLMGTPLYMSPEQMRGAQTVDARSDVWALGAILYRLLTNRTPFEGDSVTQICAAVVADEPERVGRIRSDVPVGLDAAVMRCLEKEPSQRFQSVRDLARELAPFADPRAVASAPALVAVPPIAANPAAPRDVEGSLAGSTSGTPARTAGATQRTPTVAVVAALLFLVAGGVIAGVVATRGSREGSPGADRIPAASAEPIAPATSIAAPSPVAIDTGASATASPSVSLSSSAVSNASTAAAIPAPSATVVVSATGGSAPSAPPAVPNSFPPPRSSSPSSPKPNLYDERY